MNLVFRSPERAVGLAVEALKADGIVHPEARFNPAAPGGLRREVAYYDRDFLSRLGRREAAEETVDAALEMLKAEELVPDTACYDKAAFVRHAAAVREHFRGSWTSLTPVMARLLYMLTSMRRPRYLLELGSFWGYTLAWFAGPCVGPHAVYEAERVVGIDMDEGAVEQARENFTRLGGTARVELLAEDARTALDRLPGPFDFVYLEAKSDEMEGQYLTLLRQVYDRLAPGAWVIAHDSLDWTFRSEMAVYLPYVRDPANFAGSVAFEVDHCGLELSIR